MASDWNTNNPVDDFDDRCLVCGENYCDGHEERSPRIRPIATVMSVLIVVSQVAGSVGFLLGARSDNAVPVDTITPRSDLPISSDPPTMSTVTTTMASPIVTITADEQLMLDVVNRERMERDLNSLSWCAALGRAATTHSRDMAARNFFEHVNPDGLEVSDRAETQGYRYRSVGENIAVGQRSVTEVMEGWMDSPGHRENILSDDYTHFGLGIATGDFEGQRKSLYWTQNFGAGGDCT